MTCPYDLLLLMSWTTVTRCGHYRFFSVCWTRDGKWPDVCVNFGLN